MKPRTRTRSATWVGALLSIAAAVALTLPLMAQAKSYPKVGAFGDRTVELVSIPDNNNASIVSGRISDDGNRVVYSQEGGAPTSSFGRLATVSADRTPAGWTQRNAEPPRSLLDSANTLIWSGGSPDLSILYFVGADQLGTYRVGQSTYRYRPASGDLLRGTANLPNRAPVNGEAAEMSPNLTRIIVPSTRKLVPEDIHPDGSRVLYDVTDPDPQLISLLPGDIPTACDAWAFTDSVWGAAHRNVVSEDGNRVLFVTRDGCSGANDIYVRQAGPDGSLAAGHGNTVAVTGPPVAGPDSDKHFVQATPDVSEVFFSTRARLEPRDGNDGPDIYRASIAGVVSCMTCAVFDAQPGVGTDENGGAEAGVVISRHGERVYFISRQSLAPGGETGEDNIYIWRRTEPDDIEFVAPGRASGDAAQKGSLVTTGVYVNAGASPDGSVLAFTSNDPRLDALTSSDNNGFLQLYRYDDRDRSLVCVSCPQGPATSNAGTTYLPGSNGTYAGTGGSGPVADGHIVVFQTSQALVPEDGNGVVDIYEWRDGRVGLITDGRARDAYASSPPFVDVTPDGRSVLFKSLADLAPGVRDSAAKLYVARLDGGFPAAPASSGCAGEGCRAASKAAPHLRSPAGEGGAEGDAVALSRRPVSLGRLSVGQRRALARGSTVGVRVQVSRPGRVRVSLGSAGTAASGVARRAGSVTLRVRLSHSGRLRLARRGRLVVVVSVRFGGMADVVARRVDLRRAK